MNTIKTLKNAIETLKNVSCSFWACEGPDVPFVHMKTCSLCQTTQDLMKLVDELERKEHKCSDDCYIDTNEDGLHVCREKGAKNE